MMIAVEKLLHAMAFPSPVDNSNLFSFSRVTLFYVPKCDKSSSSSGGKQGELLPSPAIGLGGRGSSLELSSTSGTWIAQLGI